MNQGVKSRIWIPELVRDVEQHLIVDLELGRDGRFHGLAAKQGPTERVWESGTPFQRAHAELLDWMGDSRVLVGHNLHRFDADEIAKRAPDSPLLSLPAVDTLELSVLAFARRPYHRLTKDDDLVRDAKPRPLSDVRACATGLSDALEALGALDDDEAWLLAALLSRIDHAPTVVAGWKLLFRELGWPWAPALTQADLRRAWRGRVCACSAALDTSRFDMRHAFVAAWLRANRDDEVSVLPAWVRRQFPTAPHLIRALRATRCDESSCAWCQTRLSAQHWLKRVFGYDDYRPSPATPDGESLQRVLVERGIRGEPTFGILPTGGGKSLCFQIPAEARHRLLGQLTVVISPLQSLMKDQVDSLHDRIPTARAIYGGLPTLLRPQVFQEVRDGECGLLYLSPEQLRNASILRLLGSRELGAVVFDEAHCLSQWGHDFRTDYPYVLKAIRAVVEGQGAPMPHVFLFTATVQHDAKAEILAHVEEHTDQVPAVFDGGSERENLTYAVREVPEFERRDVIVELLQEHLGGGTAIVFCGSRKRTEQTAEWLSGNGFPARAYHAGLDGAHADTPPRAPSSCISIRMRS